MNMVNKEPFQTPDFILASFLFANGILLEAIIKDPTDPYRKLFVFESTPRELISSFHAGTAHADVLAFDRAQNRLRTMLRESNG